MGIMCTTAGSNNINTYYHAELVRNNTHHDHSTHHHTHHRVKIVKNESKSQFSQQDLALLALLSWIKKNNLNESLLSVLNKHGVCCLDDLKLLQSDQDIHEFVNSLGFNIIQRKKFTAGVNALTAPQNGEKNDSTKE
eukprot:UN10804